MRHLVFQVAAPIMSFGSPGAKQERATDSHPSKGFALGFLGAALGKKREDTWHGLSSEIGFATMTIRPGVRMEDYHTVATPRGLDRYATRREEAINSDYTVETYREYLSDACFLIALWDATGVGFDLDEWGAALVFPTFELFAGRKSCPLSLPPAPLAVDSGTLHDAFKDYYDHVLYEGFRSKDAVNLAVHWDNHAEAGVKCDQIHRRKDQVANRAKRLFRERIEMSGYMQLGA